uniref:Uncharacterized protein n=1 Tax=Anguilla anguilla TaxID=7936 RepID=A0A0E9QJL2_ANGAN
MNAKWKDSNASARCSLGSKRCHPLHTLHTLIAETSQQVCEIITEELPIGASIFSYSIKGFLPQSSQSAASSQRFLAQTPQSGFPIKSNI